MDMSVSQQNLLLLLIVNYRSTGVGCGQIISNGEVVSAHQESVMSLIFHCVLCEIRTNLHRKLKKISHQGRQEDRSMFMFTDRAQEKVGK